MRKPTQKLFQVNVSFTAVPKSEFVKIHPINLQLHFVALKEDDIKNYIENHIKKQLIEHNKDESIYIKTLKIKKLRSDGAINLLPNENNS